MNSDKGKYKGTEQMSGGHLLCADRSGSGDQDNPLKQYNIKWKRHGELIEMLLIFVTNDWLDDKEIWYDENNICRIQSTTQQHWCVYQCWYAPYWLLGSWERFINHTRISLFIKRTCHWWTTWICKIISWWNDANMGGCRWHSLFIMLNNPQKF